MLRQADAAGGGGAVLRRGDPVAGAILVVARARDGGVVVWAREADGWRTVVAGDDARVDAHIQKQARYDPDLWVIELPAEQIQPLTA